MRALLGGLLAVVLGLTLSACQTKVGAAAVVDGRRIDESTLQGYVQPGATPFAAGQDAQGAPQTIVPRTFALQQLITIPVLTAVLRKNGGDPTSAELARARKSALGTETESSAQKLVTDRGFDASFTEVYLKAIELGNVATERIPDQAKLASALTSSGVTVSVAGRYGTWNPQRLSLTSGPGNPDFIATSSSSPAASVPAG